MPKKAENTAPIQVSEPKATRYSTEPVAVRMYQPRISASISKPIEVARSAGHWKRKLRTAKGASAGLRAGEAPSVAHTAAMPALWHARSAAVCAADQKWSGSDQEIRP